MKDNEAIILLTDAHVGTHVSKTNPTTSQEKTSDTQFNYYTQRLWHIKISLNNAWAFLTLGSQVKPLRVCLV